jgi:hypothetical protein
MRYLIYFRTFEVALARLLPAQFDDTAIDKMLNFVFVEFGDTMGTRIFTTEMKLRTMEILKLPHTGLGMADIRQTCIYIAMRYLLPSIKDPDNGYRATFDIQAGHSTQVAEAHYGVDIQDLPHSMTAHQFLNFKVACYLSHSYYQMQDRSQCKFIHTYSTSHLTPSLFRA